MTSGYEIVEEDSTALPARDVACSRINLRGAGKEADITISPTVNNFSGFASNRYTKQPLMSQTMVMLKRKRWVGETSTSGKDSKNEEPMAFDLKFDPPFSVLTEATVSSMYLLHLIVLDITH